MTGQHFPDMEAYLDWLYWHGRARYAAMLRKAQAVTPALIARERTVGNVTYLSRPTMRAGDGAA